MSPAAEEPTFASMNASRLARTSCLKSGISPRIDAVARQPAPVMKRRRADGLAVQLRDPVHEPLQVRGRLVQVPVPGRVVVGVPQPEIGAEVDDRLGDGFQLADAPHRAAVRQAKEQDVARFQLADRGELERRLLAQVGVDGVDVVAGVGLGGGLERSGPRDGGGGSGAPRRPCNPTRRRRPTRDHGR